MTDQTLKRLDGDVQDIIGAVLELQDLAHVEDEQSAWRNTGGGRSVEGVASDPTFARADDDYRTVSRDRIAKGLARLASQVRLELARQRPQRTGECKTRDCRGDAFFDGYCDRCDVWRRNNPGMDPASIDNGALVTAWNRTLPRFCECVCCEECHDRAAEGRTVSDRCRTKQYRARQDERAAS